MLYTKVCNNFHEEIAFNVEKCPLCDTIKAYEIDTYDLGKEIEALVLKLERATDPEFRR